MMIDNLNDISKISTQLKWEGVTNVENIIKVEKNIGEWTVEEKKLQTVQACGPVNSNSLMQPDEIQKEGEQVELK